MLEDELVASKQPNIFCYTPRYTPVLVKALARSNECHNVFALPIKHDDAVQDFTFIRDILDLPLALFEFFLGHRAAAGDERLIYT